MLLWGILWFLHQVIISFSHSLVKDCVIIFVEVQNLKDYTVTYFNLKKNTNLRMIVTILVTYANHCLFFVGSPIITDQHVSVQHGVCILSVNFFTSVSSVKIKWYFDDKLMDGNLTDISSNVDINLFCYQKLVRTNGMKTYISYDTMDYLNLTINCQIQNKYGSTEAVFNQQDFHAIFGGDATSSINKTTEGMLYFQLKDITSPQGNAVFHRT